MTEGRQSVAGAYAKIEGHEELCAERYRAVHESIRNLKGLVKVVIGGVVSIVLGLISWLALQLYTLEPLRVAAASRPSTVSVSVDPPPPAAEPAPRLVHPPMQR